MYAFCSSTIGITVLQVMDGTCMLFQILLWGGYTRQGDFCNNLDLPMTVFVCAAAALACSQEAF
jgi:hypothetical protein